MPAGTIIQPNTLISPGGQQGPTGTPGPAGHGAFTTTTANFTVPPIGGTVSVAVADTSWTVPGEYVWVAGAGGSPTSAMALQVSAVNSATSLTLLNPPAPGSAVSSDPGEILTLGSDALPYLSPGAVILDQTGAPSDITRLNVSGTAHGLMPKLGNTGQKFFRDDGVQAIPSRYYGQDSTNNGAYAITVATDFSLTPGVVVWFFLSNANAAANPTLNVNGTGALPLTNRAITALSVNELTGQRLYGAMCSGPYWLIFTPLGRNFSSAAIGTQTLECAGFDWISVWSNQNTAPAIVLTLAHVGYGVPINIKIYNAYSAAITYQINATTAAGAGTNIYFVPMTAATGGGSTPISNNNTSLAVNYCALLAGTLYLNNEVQFK